MRKKLQGIEKILSLFMLVAILLLSGMLFGIQNERNKIKQEEQAETVTNIAIVNLDEGIKENNKKSYYSTELMDNQNESFIMENLEAARNGINNGVYAAYIIIPAEFSGDVESINTVPKKATLEYAVNPNLREDVSRLTMENVKNFEISLNTNLSYLYVQAILKEFHQVQDNAGTIMSHDNEELTRILQINPESLTAELDIEEVAPLEDQIEEIDFKDELEKNRQVSESLHTNYADFAKQGQEEFAKIKGEESGVMEGVQKFCDVLAAVDVEKNEEDKLVYEAGETALYEYLDQYQQTFNTQRSVVTNMLDTFVPDTIPTLYAGMLKQSADTVNTRINNTNQENQNKITDIQNKLSQLKTTTSEPGTVTAIEELENLVEDIQTVTPVTAEELYQEAVVKSKLEELTTEIDKLPELAIVPYRDIFKDQIIKPLKEEIEKENKKVAEEGTAYTELVSAYMKKLGEFDAYKYYDEEKMNGLMNDFSGNMELLEEKVWKNKEEYQKYAYDTVAYTDEKIDKMETGLNTSYETTETNVQTEITLAKSIREGMNQSNIEMLDDFTQKLPYTRIGQLEYVQAYDFIVKPVQMSDASVKNRQRTLMWDDNLIKYSLFVLAVVWGIFTIVRTMVSLSHKGYSHTSYQE